MQLLFFFFPMESLARKRLKVNDEFRNTRFFPNCFTLLNDKSDVQQ